MTKIKLFNLILFLNFIVYIFTNLIIFKYSQSDTYTVVYLCLRDVILFLFSIAVYFNFYNSNISSLLVFPKLNSKIVKNSIIIGLSFYLIGNGINLIFTSIFKFFLKNTIYLNNVYDIYNVGFGFIAYIVLNTIFVEIFFRVILSDVFRFLSAGVRVVLSSVIFSFFFFGLSQIVYGFVIGVLLLGFLNRVGNIVPIVISSLTINLTNYLVSTVGNVILDDGIGKSILLNDSDVFINFIVPIIIVLFGFIIYSIVRDRIKLNIKAKKVESLNVTEVNFNGGVGSVTDIYLVLFFVTSIAVILISYIFLG